MALRHGTGLAAGDRARLHELDQLEHVAAHPTAEAVPALLIEQDVERPVATAFVVRAVALQQAVAFLDNALDEHFPGHSADVDIGDLPVILPDAARSRPCHFVAPSPTRRERKVLRPSPNRLHIQWLEIARLPITRPPWRRAPGRSAARPRSAGLGRPPRRTRGSESR